MNKNTEIWKDIPTFGGYQISNLGNVKSLSREYLNKGKYPTISKEKILKPQMDNSGYYKVKLSRNGIVKTMSIHVIMAMAFKGHIPCGNKVVVDHINNIKTDNRIENLQSITQRQNCSKDKKNKTSKYTGVTWHKVSNKWVSYIYVNNKIKNLGLFNTEYEAHLAYQKTLEEILNRI